MSDARSTAATPFDVQRRALEQAHRAARQSVDVQRRVSRSFVDTLDAQRDAQRDATRLAETALETWFVAARTSMPRGNDGVGEVEVATEDALAVFEDAGDEWFRAYADAMTDSVEMYDEAARAYADVLDAVFESALAANARFAERTARFADAGEDVIEVDVEAGER